MGHFSLEILNSRLNLVQCLAFFNNIDIILLWPEVPRGTQPCILKGNFNEEGSAPSTTPMI